MNVLERIGLPPIVVPPVELQSYVDAHVLLNIPTFRISLLDDAIICERDTYKPRKKVSEAYVAGSNSLIHQVLRCCW